MNQDPGLAYNEAQNQFNPMEHTLKGEFVLGQETAEEKKEPPKTHTKETHSSPHFYSSFCRYPKGITFAEREEGEEILLLLRRHFVTNIPWLLTTFLLLLLPFLSPFILANFPFPLPQNSTIMLVWAFYYLVLFGFVIVKFTLWYFHAGLVTTQRLVDIDLHGILYRQISEAKNKNIEDVSYTQIGFVRSLFNYGDVFVQTAGAESNIEYDRVPKPSVVADIIGDLQS